MDFNLDGMFDMDMATPTNNNDMVTVADRVGVAGSSAILTPHDNTVINNEVTNMGPDSGPISKKRKINDGKFMHV